METELRSLKIEALDAFSSVLNLLASVPFNRPARSGGVTMNEDKNEGPLLPISGLVIFLAALGLTFYSQSPFKGSRPTAPELPAPYEKVNARLWQDPFPAVVDHYKVRGSSASEMKAGQCSLCDETQNEMTAIQDSLRDKISQKKNEEKKITVLGGYGLWRTLCRRH